MSSVRYTSVGVMRPPKPPCWRDFISSSPKSIHSDGLEMLDSARRAFDARSPVADLLETSTVTVPLSGNRPSRLVRRPRAKIHRTRSEHTIRTEDLPENGFTATLADADPKGLRVRIPDGRLYVDENNRRCQNWLVGVQAAEPLDEVDYTVDHQPFSSTVQETLSVEPDNSYTQKTEDAKTHSSGHPEKDPIPVFELRQSVDVEVPEETFIWDTSSKANSTSSDEGMSATFKDIICEEDCEKISEIPLCSGSFSSTHSAESPALNPSLNPLQQSGATIVEENTKGDTCEISSGNCSAKSLKCDQPTHDNKCIQFSCDRDYTESVSGMDNNSFRSLVPPDKRGENLLKHLDAKVDSGLNKNSHLSLPGNNRRSLTRRTTSDSELWALNVSTCD